MASSHWRRRISDCISFITSLIHAISDSCAHLGMGRRRDCIDESESVFKGSGGKNTGAFGLRGEEVVAWISELNRR